MQRNLVSSSFLVILMVLGLTIMEGVASAAGGDAAVHIVYCEKPEGEEPESYHLRTLTSVLGSEEAAKEAMLYSYKNAASGFSAKLTPEQVSQISRFKRMTQDVGSCISW